MISQDFFFINTYGCIHIFLFIITTMDNSDIKRNLQGGAINVLIVILCLGMVGSGMIKIMSLPSVVVVFENWGFPPWFRYGVGIWELVIGIAIFIPKTRKIALMALMMEMLGALTVHLVYGEYYDGRGPIMVLALTGLLWWLEFKSNRQ